MDNWDNNRQGPFEDMDQTTQFGFPGGFGPPFGQGPGGQFQPPFGPPFGQGPGGLFQPPFGPPFGQGPGGQFQPPFGPPFGQAQGGQFGPPSGPPPAFIPQQAGISVQAVDPGAIRRCRFRFVFIRLTTGQQFWIWLVFVGPRSIAGWRWTGFRWVYFGIDINLISSFVCY